MCFSFRAASEATAQAASSPLSQSHVSLTDHLFSICPPSCRPSSTIIISLEQGQPRHNLHEKRPRVHQPPIQKVAGELLLQVPQPRQHPQPRQLRLQVLLHQRSLSLGNEVEPRVQREEVLLLRACITMEKASIREPFQVNTLTTHQYCIFDLNHLWTHPKHYSFYLKL